MYNKASFIRPIPVKDWGIMFDVVAEKNNFSALSIVLNIVLDYILIVYICIVIVNKGECCLIVFYMI